MGIEIKNIEDVEKLVVVSSTIIVSAIKIGSLISDLVKGSNLPEEDKSIYIARIKKAQEGIMWED